ncbi:MAG TPA: helix-turn-helix transcriptional regulator, partial [Polyangiales bacterium]
EASLRLRLFSSDAVAVIGPDGKLVHAEGDSASRSSRKSLAAQATRIERARSGRERADPQRALALWRALVDGRWSLVERYESDGRRQYFVFENAPHLRSQRALSDLQSRVVELSLRGLTGKEVAYELGVSQASVSYTLEVAATRLGFGSRTDLLRTGAGLLDTRAEPLATSFTEAEQEVLSLVRQGWTNRQIAHARSTSPNTVANQLAALRRKTGASSRRGLAIIRP